MAGRHDGSVNRDDDVLSLEVRHAAESPWGNEVIFAINGVPLIELIRREGVKRDWIGPPVRVVAPPSDHLFGGPDRWEDPQDSWFDDDRVAVGACLCGQPGCEALLMTVEFPPGLVRWTDFDWYRGGEADLSALEFHFDRDQYEAVLEGLREDA